MKRPISLSFFTRVIFFVVVLALLMAGAAVFYTRYFLKSVEDTFRASYESHAAAVGEALAAQFFERYGDANEIAASLKYVLKQKALATDLLNSLVAHYQIYDLSLVVDLNGKLIASNSKDRSGRDLPIDRLKGMDFSNRDWFTAAKALQFTEEPRKGLVGTFFEDAAFDADVSSVYNEPRRVTGFTVSFRQSFLQENT